MKASGDIAFIDDDHEYPLTYVITGAMFEQGGLPSHDNPGYAPEYDYKSVYLQGDLEQTDLSAQPEIFSRALQEVEAYFADFGYELYS